MEEFKGKIFQAKLSPCLKIVYDPESNKMVDWHSTLKSELIPTVVDSFDPDNNFIEAVKYGAWVLVKDLDSTKITQV